MPESAYIPVGRAAPLGRAALLAVVGIMCSFPAIRMWPELRFVPSATSNRITDYAIAWLAGLLLLLGLGLCGRSVKWAALAVWPGRLGFDISANSIQARLGPFGTWSAAPAELSVDWPEYLFDLDLDADRPLPINECPPITIDSGNTRIDVQLRRFGLLSEGQWWPMVEPRIRALVFDDPRWQD